jgi:type II secretory pathway component PulF
VARTGLTMTSALDTVDVRPLNADQLATGLRILADLVESGLSITRALSVFADLAPEAWNPGLPGIRAAVRSGRGVANALDESMLGVPEIVIGIVRAGEGGAGLAPALRRAARYAEDAAAFRSSVRAALVYPSVVALAGGAAIGLMVLVVLPRFAAVLADLRLSLPPLTRLVLAGSDLLRAAVMPGAIGTIALGAMLVPYSRRPAFRAQLHRWMLAWPAVGTLRRSRATAHVADALSALLENGITVRAGLVYAAAASGDVEIGRRVLAARTRISAGERIARALELEGALTPAALRLVAAGEETGALGRMLEYVSRIERSQVERRVRAGTRLIEPVLILFFALVVGVVAAAMLQAVYAVRPA